MKRVLYGITGLCFLLLLLAAGGCASPARIIGIDSDEALVTVSGIDPADWQRAAEENIRSLLASGALRRTDGQQPVVMISRIRSPARRRSPLRSASAATSTLRCAASARKSWTISSTSPPCRSAAP